MAKIKFGSVVTDSRGHIDGITYKWARAGNVAQRRVTPVHKQSSATTRARANFATLSQRWWSTLTPTQRTDWRALAAANPRPNVWGDEFPITGLALFLGINSLLATAGFAGTDDAPADQTVTALATLSITATPPDELILTFTPTPLPTDHLLYIFARPNFSPGILNSSGRDSFLLASSIEISSTLDVGPDFLARFGALLADRQQLVRAALLNTVNGALSAAITATVIA